jgi:IS4 transposase
MLTCYFQPSFDRNLGTEVTGMILGKVFDRFARYSPVTVMMRGILEYVFPPQRLDELFRNNAEEQYEDELLFSTAVNTLALAVTGTRDSVNAAYQASKENFTVSVTSLYNKLKGTETQVSQALVRESATRLEPVIKQLRAQTDPPLPGYRTRIIDGNHLAATEHRIEETRHLHSAPLPGQALVVLDPQLRLATDVFPCEDAYAQERSLSDQVLETVEPGDLWLGDRNFCTTGLLFGIRRRQAFFLIRQHASTLWGKKTVGRRRRIGRCETGVVYEQKLRICSGKEKDPEREEIEIRRITIKLDKATRDGETEIHILTNVPETDADAIRVAELYRTRWRIEYAFQELGQALRSEVDTLCYPAAALLAFCVGLYTYNVLSVMKAAIRSAHKNPKLLDELSGYYLAEEISATYWGMMIAIQPRHWTKAFSQMTADEIAHVLKELAGNVDVRRFRKHKRSPKKPPPRRTGGLREKHVSTARLLAARERVSTPQ